MKVLSVIGARPQFIKEAIIQKTLKKYKVEEVLVHTGQHYDANMSEVFFQVLEMDNPRYHLDIHGGSHGWMTGKMIVELERIFMDEEPDLVILYGDTDSTLAGAIAASKLNIKIAHIEAGLRQNPKEMPEEINRVITDRISKYLFCPTQLAINNLKHENNANEVIFAGDVMYDVFLLMKEKFEYKLIEKLGLEEENYIVMTLHRDFNVDEKLKLEKILIQVEAISKKIKIVLPIHPRTKQKISLFNLERYLKDVIVIAPLNYLELMGLTMKCKCVVTDSGGYQKEAYFAGKRAYVLMPDTSWRELVECGWNKLTNEDTLASDVFEEEEVVYIENIYGRGEAGETIVRHLLEKWSNDEGKNN